MVSFWLHAVNDEAQGQVVLSEMYTSFQEGQEMILREDVRPFENIKHFNIATRSPCLQNIGVCTRIKFVNAFSTRMEK